MSTINLLEKIKNFLSNNTANKLFREDYLSIEKGAVVIIRYDALALLYCKLKSHHNFPLNFSTTFNQFIEQTYQIILDHGGVLINFDTTQMSILIDKELTLKNDRENLLYALHCSQSIFLFYLDFFKKISVQYDFEINPSITVGVNFGHFVDMIVGNNKRKDRILLGSTVSKAMNLAYIAENKDIMISKDIYKLISDDITISRKKRNYSIKKIKTNVDKINLPSDDYLNLKTSILKSFLPNYVYDSLKENSENETLIEYKDGSIINLEIHSLHIWADDFLEKYPHENSASDKKMYEDDFYFGINKLFKKIFRYINKFDGSLNKIDLSLFGIRLILSFSFPKTFVNDSTNYELCFEELAKMMKQFKYKRKRFPYKIIHFYKKMFASIIGNIDSRMSYILFDSLFEKFDELLESIPENSILKLPTKDKMLENHFDSICPPENIPSIKHFKTIDFKDLHSHKVIGRNKEIIFLNQLLRKGGKILSITGKYGCGKSRIIDEISSRMTKEKFNVIKSKTEQRDNILDLFKYIIAREAEITLLDSDFEIKNKMDIYLTKLITNPDTENLKERFLRKKFVLYKWFYNIEIEPKRYAALTPALRLEFIKEALSLFLIFHFSSKSIGYNGIIYIFEDVDNLRHEEKDIIIYVIQYALSHMFQRGRYTDRNLSSQKVSFILTYKDQDELEFNPFLRPENINLSPLKKDTMTKLLSKISKEKRFPSEIKKAILKQAEGNPFYLEQYFYYIFSTKMIKDMGDYLEKTDKYHKRDIPSDILDVVKHNLRQMAPAKLKMLKAASVIGVQVYKNIFREYYEAYDESLFQELVNERVLLPYTTKDCYIFTHPIISDTLYNMAKSDELQKWHSKVAIFLEKSYRLSKFPHPTWLGHHHARAKNKPAAIKFLDMSYKDAISKNFIELALQQIALLMGFYQSGIAKDILLLDKAKILYLLKDFQRARKITSTLLSKYDSDKKSQGFLSEIISTILEYTIRYSPFKTLEELLHKQSFILRYNEDISKKIILYKHYSLLKIREGRFKEAIKYLTKGIDFATQENDNESLCFIYDHLAQVYMEQKRYQKAQEILELAIPASKLLLNPILFPQILVSYGQLLAKKGKIISAKQYLTEAVKLAEEISLKVVELMASMELGTILFMENEHEKAKNYFENALKIARALNRPKDISSLLLSISYYNIMDNNQIEAEKCINKARKIGKEIKSSYIKNLSKLAVGHLKATKKHYEDAQAQFKSVARTFREKDNNTLAGRAFFFLSQLHYEYLITQEQDAFIKYKKAQINNSIVIYRYINRAISYSKKAKDIYYLCQEYLILGSIFLRKNKTSDAIVNLKEGFLITLNTDYVNILYQTSILLYEACMKASKTRGGRHVIQRTLQYLKEGNHLDLEKKFIEKISEIDKSNIDLSCSDSDYQ